MKDDLISRQAALTTYQDRVCYGIACIDCPFRFRVSQTATDCKLESFIHELPSAQPERKTGRWIESDTDGFVCSECRNGYRNQPTMMGKPMFEYCPVCGSKMEVEP